MNEREPHHLKSQIPGIVMLQSAHIIILQPDLCLHQELSVQSGGALNGPILSFGLHQNAAVPKRISRVGALQKPPPLSLDLNQLVKKRGGEGVGKGDRIRYAPLQPNPMPAAASLSSFCPCPTHSCLSCCLTCSRRVLACQWQATDVSSLPAALQQQAGRTLVLS